MEQPGPLAGLRAASPWAHRLRALLRLLQDRAPPRMGQPLRPERPAGRLYIDARDVVVSATLPAADGLAYRSTHRAAARSRLLDMVWRPGGSLRGLLVARHAGRSDASL